jgi:hypothetical protein
MESTYKTPDDQEASAAFAEALTEVDEVSEERELQNEAIIIQFPLERARSVASDDETTRLMERAPRLARVLDYVFRLNSERLEDPIDPKKAFFGSRTFGHMLISGFKGFVRESKTLGLEAIDHIKSRRQ